MKRNLILICADENLGKECARSLAHERNLAVLDFDGLLRYTLGRSVEDVLRLVGKEYYWDALAKCLSGLGEYESGVIVISLPVLAKSENFEMLSRGGVVVYLRCDVQSTRAALDAYCKENPILCRGCKGAMSDGFRYWKQHADHTICCKGKNLRGIVTEAEEYYDAI